MRMLNLGCGSTFHSDWVNVDFINHNGKVIAYDLRLGIPFAEASFDVVYHSHVLEHMPKAWGEFFIKECFRVLRPGGLLRVVVPDLENIAQAYLKSLQEARDGDEGANQRHEWMLVELIDQLTRSQTGGEMLNWWKQQPVPQEDFIIERLGMEAKSGINSCKGLPTTKPHTALPPINTNFLLSGELHAWMYDKESLARLLKQYNFTDINSVAHNESAIPNITTYGLDTTAEGHVRKPDSLFMEAKKPSTEQVGLANVAMFCFGDEGGAAIAGIRLHHSLKNTDIKSNMYVASQKFANDQIYVVPSKITVHGGGITCDGPQAEKAVRREIAFSNQKLLSAIRRYPNRPQGSEHFSVPNQCVPLQHIPFLEDFNFLHFHWISGFCDPSLDFEFLQGKKIIWTLHDMNAFTGGCHYSNGCRKFESMCGSCPELGSAQDNDLANQTWKARMATYRKLDMNIIAPSIWLAQEARKSALLGNFPVHHIPYAQPLNVFQPLNREGIRQQLGLNQESLALLFASQSLVNTRKGGIYLVQLLHALAKTELKDNITVFMLGNNLAPEFNNTGINVQCLGHIDDTTKMAALYNAADAVLVPSLEDNLPNVICEALGCGTPVVAFANGGIVDMVQHEKTGYLAESKNVNQLLQGVIWANNARGNPVTRKLCRAFALEQWNEPKIAKIHRDLYASLLKS